ncbi:Harpin-induced protein [Hordeum vulgare]|uniref:Late embryogenesis abundant protein LEA-2 subgroup domain-containing protein n=2 Tax=Hordeum vulgare subsp. vulgare TaxID=112509 RepID=A0A8I6XCL5_HORVV|nr:Harpin-induced protein [Hordeum vulgare]KAI5013218.1 hypothetical protein ZWY2020_028172 [Hordeum vulgare]
MKRKPVVICCSVLLALIVVLAIVFVALYFTVFRPRSPHVVATVVSTRVSHFNVTPDFPIVLPRLNMSMDVDVTVKNPNYAAFRYGDVVTELTYHGLPVGQSVVLAGEVGARTTQTVGATVVVQADKVVFSPDFIGDVLPKLLDLPDIMLPFQTRTTVAGKAVVLGTFKIRASSAVTCSVSTYPVKQETTADCTSTVNIG